MEARDSRSWPLTGEVVSGEKSETSSLESFEREETQVVGTTNLYQNGQLRLIPVCGSNLARALWAFRIIITAGC